VKGSFPHVPYTIDAKPLGRRVLCIDDNCDVLRIEQSILEEAGYEVTTASNGVDGLSLLGRTNVDLVVLDCEMPQLNGIEVARRIRAIHPTVRIIMVSGVGMSEELAGIVDCFVPKTSMVPTLVLQVNRLLRNPKAVWK